MRVRKDRMTPLAAVVACWPGQLREYAKWPGTQRRRLRRGHRTASGC